MKVVNKVKVEGDMLEGKVGKQFVGSEVVMR